MLLAKKNFKFHARVPKWHFWTRALNLIFFWPKVFLWSIMKMAIRIFFCNTSQSPPNPSFMQEKVQKGDFLKKNLRELNFSFCFGFLWISRRPGTLNWKWLVFLTSKNLYNQCVLSCPVGNASLKLYLSYQHTPRKIFS